MGKTEKNNHGKVPKITEEEYTAYVNHLRELSEVAEQSSAAGKIVPQEDGNRTK